jgi:hypothetical protein
MEFVGTALLVIGLAWMGLFGFIHFRAVAKAGASETWPATPGKVLSSRVVEEKSRDRDGSSSTWYNPVVTYSYDAGGNSLQSSRIRFANMRQGRRAKAEEIAARYPEGSAPMVRYNPAKPAEAVLETQKPGPLYLVMAAAGLLFVGFGLFWNMLISG